MLDPALLYPYLPIALALAVSPGPDTLFVLANGMENGSKAAIVATLGICISAFMHALLAALGIAALLIAFPFLFDWMRLIGAGFLIWLGVQALKRAWSNEMVGSKIAPVKKPDLWRVFQKGMFTNLTNPKVILFYAGLLPQFVNPALGLPGVQMILLAFIHIVFGLVFLVAVGLTCGSVAQWLKNRRHSSKNSNLARKLFGSLTATIFFGLAVRLALMERD